MSTTTPFTFLLLTLSLIMPGCSLVTKKDPPEQKQTIQPEKRIEQAPEPARKDQSANVPVLLTLSETLAQYIKNGATPENLRKVIQAIARSSPDELNGPMPTGTSPLRVALEHRALWGMDQITTELINKGADVDALDADGESFLTRALGLDSAPPVEIMKLAIHRSSRINNTNSKGKSPLLISLKHRNAYWYDTVLNDLLSKSLSQDGFDGIGFLRAFLSKNINSDELDKAILVISKLTPPLLDGAKIKGLLTFIESASWMYSPYRDRLSALLRDKFMITLNKTGVHLENEALVVNAAFSKPLTLAELRDAIIVEDASGRKIDAGIDQISDGEFRFVINDLDISKRLYLRTRDGTIRGYVISDGYHFIQSANVFADVDAYARNAPASSNLTLDGVANYLGAYNGSELLKLRALYAWIANNITYDTESFFSGKYQPVDPAFVFKTRSSVCQGYANLFERIGRKMGLAIETVTGKAKGYSYRPGAPYSSNHAWNIAAVNGKKLLIDSTWGAGHLDGRIFKMAFDGFYFATPPEEFVLTHFPERPDQQLLDKPIPYRDFDGGSTISYNAIGWKVGPLKVMPGEPDKLGATLFYPAGADFIAAVESSDPKVECVITSVNKNASVIKITNHSRTALLSIYENKGHGTIYTSIAQLLTPALPDHSGQHKSNCRKHSENMTLHN